MLDAAILLEAGWDTMVHEVWVTIVPPAEVSIFHFLQKYQGFKIFDIVTHKTEILRIFLSLCTKSCIKILLEENTLCQKKLIKNGFLKKVAAFVAKGLRMLIFGALHHSSSQRCGFEPN